jgi:hypothetical protein
VAGAVGPTLWAVRVGVCLSVSCLSLKDVVPAEADEVASSSAGPVSPAPAPAPAPLPGLTASDVLAASVGLKPGIGWTYVHIESGVVVGNLRHFMTISVKSVCRLHKSCSCFMDTNKHGFSEVTCDLVRWLGYGVGRSQEEHAEYGKLIADRHRGH